MKIILFLFCLFYLKFNNNPRPLLARGASHIEEEGQLQILKKGEWMEKNNKKILK